MLDDFFKSNQESVEKGLETSFKALNNSLYTTINSTFSTFSTDYEIILCSNNGQKITGKRIGSVWNIPKDNVIVTSACVAGWNYEDAEDIWLKIHEYFGNNFFLEVQYHNTDKQKELNKKIL